MSGWYRSSHSADGTRAAAASAMVALRNRAKKAGDTTAATNYQRQLNCHRIATEIYRRGARL